MATGKDIREGLKESLTAEEEATGDIVNVVSALMHIGNGIHELCRRVDKHSEALESIAKAIRSKS